MDIFSVDPRKRTAQIGQSTVKLSYKWCSACSPGNVLRNVGLREHCTNELMRVEEAVITNKLTGRKFVIDDMANETIRVRMMNPPAQHRKALQNA